MEVTTSPAGDALDQPADDPAHLRFELGDLPRYELRAEQAPVLGVLRRIEFERDEGLLAEVEAAARRGEVLGMAEGPVHVLVAADEHHRRFSHGAPCHRAFAPHPAVGRMRVVGHVRREDGRGQLGLVGLGHGHPRDDRSTTIGRGPTVVPGGWASVRSARSGHGLRQWRWRLCRPRFERRNGRIRPAARRNDEVRRNDDRDAGDRPRHRGRRLPARVVEQVDPLRVAEDERRIRPGSSFVHARLAPGHRVTVPP